VAEFETGIRTLQEAVRTRGQGRIEAAATSLDTLAGTVVKPQTDAGWRENCEVFLVAIVIALAVRTYFLQPFTIPTGSMQPTLNGIVGYPTVEPPAESAVRAFQKAALAARGSMWSRNRTTSSSELRRRKRFSFSPARPEGAAPRLRRIMPARYAFPLLHGAITPAPCRRRDARGYYDTGDHVFVDKMTYHFRAPKAGRSVRLQHDRYPNAESPRHPFAVYIKRLVGTRATPCASQPPEFSSMANAHRRRAQAVMQGTFEQAVNGYRGYGNGPDHRGWDQLMRAQAPSYLSSATSSFTVPAD
jgi:signal peptidase I